MKRYKKWILLAIPLLILQFVMSYLIGIHVGPVAQVAFQILMGALAVMYGVLAAFNPSE